METALDFVAATIKKMDAAGNEDDALSAFKPFAIKMLNLADVDNSGTIDIHDIAIVVKQIIALVGDLSTTGIAIFDHAFAKPTLTSLITAPFQEFCLSSSSGVMDAEFEAEFCEFDYNKPSIPGIILGLQQELKQAVQQMSAHGGGANPLAQIAPVVTAAKGFVSDMLKAVKNIKVP